jgi:hypothetical protein
MLTSPPSVFSLSAAHSTALHTTSIWENTIGLQQDQAGTNSAIEASIYAPGGGGRGRDARRQRAQELIESSELAVPQASVRPDRRKAHPPAAAAAAATHANSVTCQL